MPIFVETDNSKEKLYDGSKAGQAATKVQDKMKSMVKKAIDDAPGFTTTKSGNGDKGYIIRLEIKKLDQSGHDTTCTLSGAILLYPKSFTKIKGKADEMMSVGWHSTATASGTNEGSILQCVEATAEAM